MGFNSQSVDRLALLRFTATWRCGGIAAPANVEGDIMSTEDGEVARILGVVLCVQLYIRHPAWHPVDRQHILAV
jgi:hypothetical protein